MSLPLSSRKSFPAEVPAPLPAEAHPRGPMGLPCGGRDQRRPVTHLQAVWAPLAIRHPKVVRPIGQADHGMETWTQDSILPLLLLLLLLNHYLINIIIIIFFYYFFCFFFCFFCFFLICFFFFFFFFFSSFSCFLFFGAYVFVFKIEKTFFVLPLFCNEC
jgi:hypothetical protein